MFFLFSYVFLSCSVILPTLHSILLSTLNHSGDHGAHLSGGSIGIGGNNGGRGSTLPVEVIGSAVLLDAGSMFSFFQPRVSQLPALVLPHLVHSCASSGLEDRISPQLAPNFFPRVRTPCGHGAQVIIEGKEIQSDGGEKDKDNPTTNKTKPTTAHRPRLNHQVVFPLY